MKFIIKILSIQFCYNFYFLSYNFHSVFNETCSYEFELKKWSTVVNNIDDVPRPIKKLVKNTRQQVEYKKKFNWYAFLVNEIILIYFFFN